VSKIIDKVMGVIGFEVEDGETEDRLESQMEDSDRIRRQKKANLLSLPTQRPVTMMLIKAKSFDEVESVAQNIKERRPVIVNFDEADKDTAQRMVDFLSGSVFALDGSVQKVAAGTFLFATCNVDVVGQINEEDREKAFFKGFSWTKK